MDTHPGQDSMDHTTQDDRQDDRQGDRQGEGQDGAHGSGDAAVKRLREVTELAVERTATAYAEDSTLEIGRRLRTEMAAGGVEIDDDEWVAEVARSIRAGHHIRFDHDDAGATA